MYPKPNQNLFKKNYSYILDENHLTTMNKDVKKKISKKKKPTHMRDKLSRILFAFLKRDRPSVSRERASDVIYKAGQFVIQGLICEGTFGRVLFSVFTEIPPNQLPIVDNVRAKCEHPGNGCC